MYLPGCSNDQYEKIMAIRSNIPLRMLVVSLPTRVYLICAKLE
jgi:hypothetical protein